MPRPHQAQMPAAADPHDLRGREAIRQRQPFGNPDTRRAAEDRPAGKAGEETARSLPSAFRQEIDERHRCPRRRAERPGRPEPGIVGKVCDRRDPWLAKNGSRPAVTTSRRRIRGAVLALQRIF